MKELAALPKSIQMRVVEKIRGLANDPRPPGFVASQGRRWKGHSRIRLGDYRIIYRIVDQKLLVQVVGVGDRKGIYDR